MSVHYKSSRRVAIEHMVLKMLSFTFQTWPISQNFLKSVREFIFGTKRGIRRQIILNKSILSMRFKYS